MKKLAILIATLLIVCLMACACGTTPDDSSTPDSSTESSSTQTSTPDETSSVPETSSTDAGNNGGNNNPPAAANASSLVASELNVGDYAQGDLLGGIFYVTTGGSKGITVDSSSAVSFGSYAGVQNRMKLGGAMDNTFKNAIKFTTEGACTLTVWAKGGNSTDTTRAGWVLDSNGQQVGEVSAPFPCQSAPGMATFAIPAAGTYYFGGNVNGINVYFIGIS